MSFLYVHKRSSETCQLALGYHPPLFFSPCLYLSSLQSPSSTRLNDGHLVTLGEQVQRATGQDKASLVLGNRMLGLDLHHLASVLLGNPEGNLALATVLEHLVQTDRSHLIAGVNQVVILLVGERQGHDTLLLEVGLVDSGKGLGDDDAGAQVTGLKGSVLARGALAVVVLGNDEPGLVALLPLLGQLGNGVLGAVEVVGDVDLARGGVDGRVERVLRDVGQVALVLEPGAGGGDGVGCALAGDLDKHAQAGEVRVGERLKGLEEGETLRGGRDGDFHVRVGGSRLDLEDLAAGFEGGFGTLETLGRGELEFLAVGGGQAVGDGVEGGGTGVGHGGDDFGRGEEVHGFEVTVVATAEVSVVGSKDGVGGALGDVILTLPLADAGTAGVREDNTTSLLESLKGVVSLKGSTNALGTGGNVEVGSGLDTSLLGGLDNALATGHVLVGAVSAATDQTSRKLLGPLLLLDSLLELGKRNGKIGSEGTVDMGLKLRKVDLDQLVVLSALVGLELEERVLTGALGEVLEVLGVLVSLLAVGGLEVAAGSFGEGEDGGSGANLSTVATRVSQYVLNGEGESFGRTHPILQRVEEPEHDRD